MKSCRKLSATGKRSELQATRLKMAKLMQVDYYEQAVGTGIFASQAVVYFHWFQ
jgi:hypothetical protein